MLRDAEGEPVTGERVVHFAIYGGAGSATALWSETQTIAFTGGLFTAQLGAASRLPSTLFVDTAELFVGIRIDGDDEMPRVRIGSQAFAAYATFAGQARRADEAAVADVAAEAARADDADRLGGQSLADVIAAAVAGAESAIGPPAWSSLTGIPAGFADGIDNDSFADVACPAGQWLRSTGAAWECATLPAPAWSSLTGVPAGFADGVDNDTLAALTCADGQLARFSAGAWRCATEAVAPVTSVNAGTGLSVSATTGNVTVSANTAVLQARVAGACPAGQSIRQINADGTVVCQSDTNTNCATPGTCTQVCIGNDCRSSWPTSAPVTIAATGRVAFANNSASGSTHEYVAPQPNPISVTVTLESDGSFNRNATWEVRWLRANGTVVRDWTVISGTNILAGGDGGSGMRDAELATIPFIGDATRVVFRKVGLNAAAIEFVAFTYTP